VLGAILLEPALLPRAIELLVPEEFYKEAHRKIFGAMIRLFERGEPADAITLTETLRREGVFEEIGGHTLLATLQEEGTVATQFTAYTGIVREKALLREMIRVAREIVEEGYQETDDVQALLDRAEQMLFRISQRRFQRSAFPVREILAQAIQHIETLYHRKEDITGLATGFTELDKRTSGLQRSDFVIIAGRPSTGKTAFALNLAAHAAVELGRPALIFSLEMSKEQLVQRLICAEARVDSQKVRSGFLQPPEWRRIIDAAGRLSEAPLFIDDTATLRSWRHAPGGASRPSTGSSWWWTMAGRECRRNLGDLALSQGPRQGAQHPRRGSLPALPRGGIPGRRAASSLGSSRVRCPRAGRGPDHVPRPQGERPRRRGGDDRPRDREAPERTHRAARARVQRRVHAVRQPRLARPARAVLNPAA
jgi:hypothetical protein